MPTAYDKLISVQLTQPGFSTYTGFLRRHEFKDGKSVGKIPVRMALLLGASCSCIDADTKEVLSPNTYTFDADEGMGEVSAADFDSSPGRRVSDVEDERMAAIEEDYGAALSEDPMDGSEDINVGFHEPGDDHEDPRVWSRQELEAIADDAGIGGLREVGDALDVKARGIDELMTAILSKQSSAPLQILNVDEE